MYARGSMETTGMIYPPCVPSAFSQHTTHRGYSHPAFNRQASTTRSRCCLQLFICFYGLSYFTLPPHRFTCAAQLAVCQLAHITQLSNCETRWLHSLVRGLNALVNVAVLDDKARLRVARHEHDLFTRARAGVELESAGDDGQCRTPVMLCTHLVQHGQHVR